MQSTNSKYGSIYLTVCHITSCILLVTLIIVCISHSILSEETALGEHLFFTSLEIHLWQEKQVLFCVYQVLVVNPK